jgi:hypothetical protein
MPAVEHNEQDVETMSVDYNITVDDLDGDEEMRLRVVSRFIFAEIVCYTSKTLLYSDCLKLPGSTDTAASFEFAKEDHTLGNALRWVIMKKCVVVQFTGL